MKNFKETVKMINENKFEELRSKDQLQLEKEKKNIFLGFSEGELNFAPTYKISLATNTYDK